MEKFFIKKIEKVNENDLKNDYFNWKITIF